jgi:hypothetical protein
MLLAGAQISPTFKPQSQPNEIYFFIKTKHLRAMLNFPF